MAGLVTACSVTEEPLQRLISGLLVNEAVKPGHCWACKTDAHSIIASNNIEYLLNVEVVLIRNEFKEMNNSSRKCYWLCRELLE